MVEITLFGFGDDCPKGFEQNKRQLKLKEPEVLVDVIKKAGFDNLDGLVLLLNNQGVPVQNWPSTVVKAEDSLKILSAIEGG